MFLPKMGYFPSAPAPPMLYMLSPSECRNQELFNSIRTTARMTITARLQLALDEGTEGELRDPFPGMFERGFYRP